MDRRKHLDSIKIPYEILGKQMIAIGEPEKIAKSNATRFVRRWTGLSFINNPIQSYTSQDFIKQKTVERRGILFLVEHDIIIATITKLNKKFAYGNGIAFISDDSFRDKKKRTF